MPDSVEKQNVLLWFTYLHGLQSACSFNTTLKAMDLLAFANASISKNLPTPNEQAQFIVNAKTSPGFDLSPSDLTTYTSFEALLDHFNPLFIYLGAYLQTVAAGAYPGSSLADFFDASISAAFPGGSKGVFWTNANSSLASVIPSVCFSAKLQVAVAKTVDDPNNKISDLVTQIATLG